ncbi:MAG: LysR substrate-binding domain-containing protein [Pseudomonadota bacterium]
MISYWVRSQAIATSFPAVTFSVEVGGHTTAQAALEDFSADLVLVFEPVLDSDLQSLYALEAPLVVVGARGHPVFDRPVLKLRDCLSHPVALLRCGFGGRRLQDAGLRRRHFDLTPVPETNSFELLRRYVLKDQVITFQTQIGSPFTASSDLECRIVDQRDVAPGRLVLGRLRGRTLPVASAKFANRIATKLETLSFSPDGPQR